MGPAPGLHWQPPQHDAYATIPQTNRNGSADCRWQGHNEQVIPECRHDYRCWKCGAQGLEHALTLTNRRGEHRNPSPPQLTVPIHEVHNRPPQNTPTRLSERARFPFTILNQTGPDMTQWSQPVPFGTQLRRQWSCCTCNQATLPHQSPALLPNTLDQGYFHARGDECGRPHQSNPSRCPQSEFSQDDSERFPLMCYYSPCRRRCDYGCHNDKNNKSDFRPSPPNYPFSAGDQMDSRKAQMSPSRCKYCRCIVGCQCGCHFPEDGRLPRPLQRKQYLTPALYYPYHKADFDTPNNHPHARPVSHTPAQSTETSVRIWPSVSPTSEGSGWFDDHPYSDREDLLSPAVQTRERFMTNSYDRVDKSTERDIGWISEIRDGIVQRIAIAKGMDWPDGVEGLQDDEFVNRWDSGIGRWVWEQGFVEERFEDPLLEISNAKNGVKAGKTRDWVTDANDGISELDLEAKNPGPEAVPAAVELPATEPEEEQREIDSFARLLGELINTAKEIRKMTRRERHMSFIYHKILDTGDETSPDGISGDSEDFNPVPEEYQEGKAEVGGEKAKEIQARIEDAET